MSLNSYDVQRNNQLDETSFVSDVVVEKAFDKKIRRIA